MTKILGIDVGTNSVGWALVEEDENVIDSGVRIFPVGVNEEKYLKSHVEESKSLRRRLARSARRRNFRYKLRRDYLTTILKKLNMYPDRFDQNPLELYGLRVKGLDDKLELKDLGRILLLINKRRGFKSSRKGGGDVDEDKKGSSVYDSMNKINNIITEGNFRTIGEYFYSLFEKGNDHNGNPYDPAERIRDRFVYRKNYIDEFNALWEKQQEYYPEVLTNKNKEIIRDEIIFYVRPLKSQKHLIRKCRFYPTKRVAPKSSPLYQEFRYWQTINSIRVDEGEHVMRQLTVEEKHELANFLNTNEVVTQSKIKTLLQLPKSADFNDLPPKIKGNTTYAGLLKALGEDTFRSFNKAELFLLWEKLHYATTEDWLRENLNSKYNFTNEQIENILKISPEEEYGNVSTKAIKEILPKLKEGMVYSDACEAVDLRHSDFRTEDDDDPILTDIIETGNKDDLLTNITNPLVKKSVIQCIKVINAVIKRYGKPDKIRIEMGRSLSMGKEDREKMHRKNRDKRELRDKYAEFLRAKLHKQNISKSEILKFELWLELDYCKYDFERRANGLDITEFEKFRRNIKSSDFTKFKLWLECGRISVYSGKVISLEELFSPNIEIEHIFPYSKSFDNSFLNKSLCERELNKLKGNETAAKFMKRDPKEYRAFTMRVQNLPPAKKKRFLTEDIPEDFRSNQLNNTRYIATVLKNKCMEAFKTVEVGNGTITSVLRREWGLNTILNDRGNVKTRDDHRHHAIDAIAVAFTSRGVYHHLSTPAKFTHYGSMECYVPEPFAGFRTKVKSLIDTMLISHSREKRLITTKINKYVHRRGNSRTPQKSYAVRGQLHEETFYGRIYSQEVGDYIYVTRKPLADIDKPEKIIDLGIRRLVKEQLELGKKMKEIAEAGLYIRQKNGKLVPIKRVRTKSKDKTLFALTINSGNNTGFDRYLKAGNNYMAAISENEKGKRAFHVVSLMEAVTRKMNNLPLFDIPEGSKLIVTFNQDDTILLYNEHPDEIDFNDKHYLHENLYKVRKFSSSKEVGIIIHNSANSDNILRKGGIGLKFIKVKIDILGKLVLEDD